MGVVYCFSKTFFEITSIPDVEKNITKTSADVACFVSVSATASSFLGTYDVEFMNFKGYSAVFDSWGEAQSDEDDVDLKEYYGKPIKLNSCQFFEIFHVPIIYAYDRTEEMKYCNF